MQLVYPRIFLLKFSLGKFWEGKRRRGQAIEVPRGQKNTPLTMQLVYPRIFLLKFPLGKFWEGKRGRGRSIEVTRGQNKSPLEQTRGDKAAGTAGWWSNPRGRQTLLPHRF